VLVSRVSNPQGILVIAALIFAAFLLARKTLPVIVHE
jgi:hypothetical protein